MEIIRLPTGKQAPVDADCIRIEQVKDGEYKLTASALCVGDGNSDSVTLVNHPLFESAAQAEAAGVEWAESVGVTQLMVSNGTLQHPLELVEIDKPL